MTMTLSDQENTTSRQKKHVLKEKVAAAKHDACLIVKASWRENKRLTLQPNELKSG